MVRSEERRMEGGGGEGKRGRVGRERERERERERCVPSLDRRIRWLFS